MPLVEARQNIQDMKSELRLQHQARGMVEAVTARPRHVGGVA